MIYLKDLFIFINTSVFSFDKFKIKDNIKNSSEMLTGKQLSLRIPLYTIKTLEMKNDLQKEMLLAKFNYITPKSFVLTVKIMKMLWLLINYLKKFKFTP